MWPQLPYRWSQEGTPLSPWDSPGKYIGVGCHVLLQRIFLTQGLNPQAQSPPKPMSIESVMPASHFMRVQSLGQKDPLEEDMATHSSVLAWRIPWTE